MITRTLLLTSSVLLALAPAASGHGDGDGRGHGHGHGPGVGIVASGLDNPRGIDLDPSTGAIYIAQAGRGGAGPCIPSPEDPEAPPACLGSTGAITRIANGRQRDVVSGLPSIASNGAFASGPQDVDVERHGFGSFVTGLGGSPTQRGLLGDGAADLGWLFVFTPSGRVQKRADLTAYEETADPVPDPDGPDSNPTSVLNTRRGAVAVDAGGNDLLRVRRRGDISTIAVFESRLVDSPPEIPDLPPQLPMQAVPTAVTKGPDGAYYVSQLTGFPFPAGGANVYRVEPGSEPTVYASGLTNVTDLAFGRDGTLYVVEISKNGLLSGDPAGELLEIPPGGGATHTSVASAEALVEPYGVAIGRHGELYVTNHSTSAGGGQVVRVR
jgi:hypothetical protein